MSLQTSENRVLDTTQFSRMKTNNYLEAEEGNIQLEDQDGYEDEEKFSVHVMAKQTAENIIRKATVTRKTVSYVQSFEE
jgi:hypothetical protein